MPLFSNIANAIKKPFIADPADPAYSEYRQRDRLSQRGYITADDGRQVAYPQQARGTPQINPNEQPGTSGVPALPPGATSGLPDLPATPRIVPPTYPGPPGSMPAPARQPRDEAMRESEHVFQAGTPSRFKSGLRGALRGAAQGLASGGGLGGALGGAVAGGAYGAIDPAGARRQRFEMEEKPRLLDEYAREDAAGVAARKQQMEETELGYKQAQIGEMNRRSLPRPQRPQPLMNFSRGIFDPNTGEIIKGTEPPPQRERPYWVETPGGFIDLNDPKTDPKKVRKLQRPTGRGGQKDAKAMEKAVAEFDRTKQSLEEATSRGDTALARDLRKRLQGMATSLSSRYGDKLEVGGGQWPYQKTRGGLVAAPQAAQQAPQTQQSQLTADAEQLRKYAAENEISIEEAVRDFKKAGIQMR